MKILLVSQPASDGVFRYVEGLVDYLLAQGFSVHLAYSDRAACDQLPALVERVAAAGGRTLNLRVGNAPSPADFTALRGLRRLIGEIQPEIVHAHSSKAGGLVRGLAFFGMKPRIFYTPHAYYRMNAPHGMAARLFHGIERLLKEVGTTITCSSDETAFARDCIGVPSLRLNTIVNGVDGRRFHPATAEEKRTLRTQFGIPPDAIVLGTVGRFTTQKDPLTTYAALTKVAEQIPNLFFVHLGKGELEPAVDELLAHHDFARRCVRIPFLADTAPFYRMLDGFMMASLYEGMSFAVLEALANNLPLILTLAPGNQDFANYGLDHISWALPQNIDDLVEAILNWRLQISAAEPRPNHRLIAMEQFSCEIAYSRLVAAYRGEVKTPV